MPDQPSLRLARAVVFATVCLTLTTAGHAYAARCAVPPSAVGLGFLLVMGLSALLAGTERSFRTILGGLLGAQFALHALFTSATSASAHSPATASPEAGHHAAVLGGTPLHGGTAMTLAHLVAALAAAWWLRRGEAAMWSLARRVAAAAGARWPRPMTVPSPDLLAGRRPAVPPDAPPGLVPTAPLRYAVVRRGPPPALSTTHTLRSLFRGRASFLFTCGESSCVFPYGPGSSRSG